MPERNRDSDSSRLSPAAQSFLDDTLEEIRSDIIRAAVLFTDRRGLRDQEAGVRDIASALRQLGYLNREREVRQRTVRMMMAVLAVTTVFGSAAVVLYAASLQTKSSEPWLLALVSALAAAIMTVALSAIFILRRQTTAARWADPDSTEGLKLRFIQDWIEFEAKMRVMVTEALGESASGLPMTELIRAYTRLKSPPPDAAKIGELLALRNSLVHSERHYSPSRLKHALASLQHLLDL